MFSLPIPSSISRLARRTALALLPIWLAAIGLLLFFWALAPAHAEPASHIQARRVTQPRQRPVAQASSSTGLNPVPAWFSSDSNNTWSVAWGDMDGDGDLDLAAGNTGRYDYGCECYLGQPNKVYLNEGGMLSTTPVFTSSDSDYTWSVAWGDMDGDGDLDLAAGNSGLYDSGCSCYPGQPNNVYLNEGGMLLATPVFTSSDNDVTRSVAWGDMDGDGDLDLAAGNAGQPNKVYLNNNGMLLATPVFTSSDSDLTYSVAWGDMDDDGDLDLAAGNYLQLINIYRNEGGMLLATPVFTSSSSHTTHSVAWGDMDGDGDLDLAAGNYNQPNNVYLNVGGVLQTTPAFTSSDSDSTYSVTWGDMDGDGDLDLAAGNYDQPNNVYRNEGGMLLAAPVFTTSDSDETLSVAWGDMDSDGDLDLAAGNWEQPNTIYLNEGGMLLATPVFTSSDSGNTFSVAWGDMDGDGDLDLAAGNEGQPNKVYLNNNGMLLATPVFTSSASGNTRSIAWGDMDGDGDLDLAAGNIGQQNNVYLNEDGMLLATPVFTSNDSDDTLSVAWGDMDGDGDLDLAAGNYGQQNKVYLNEGGMLLATPVFASSDSDNTTSVAWGDVDGDSDLDLVAGNSFQPNKVYLNQGGMLGPIANWLSSDSNDTRSVAWGDVDGDGDLDLATGNSNQQPNNVYLNSRDARLLPGAVPTVRIVLPGAQADFFSSAHILSNTIPLTYTLYDSADNRVSQLRAFYSPDGGGRWLPAVAGSGTLTQNVMPSNFLDDFDSAASNERWGGLSGSTMTTGVCGSVSSNGLNFDSATGITRSATTKPVDVAQGGAIYFALKIGTSVAPAPCENADATDNVVLEYSTDNGVNWVTMATYTEGVYANFTPLSATIPLAAQTTGTQIRWRQLSHSGSGFDNWALDNVALVSRPAQADDFDPSLDSAQWSSRSGATVTPGICGSVTGNGLNFDSEVTTTRSATTKGLDVRGGSLILFALKIGTGVAPCENADAADNVVLEYSINNGANWVSMATYTEGVYANFTALSAAIPPAAQTTETQFRWRQLAHSGSGFDNWALDDIAIVAWPVTNVYSWNITASGFYGQSDNVVFRLEAVPAITNTANSIPGPYLYGTYASSTFPFRVRGTQVLVISSTTPISNAIVYRLPYTQTIGALPMADLAGNPYHTDGQGYLQGRGQINTNDQLIVLLPVFVTDTYGVYYTNISPTLTGLSAYTVTTSGVQTLTVSSSHPLVLFNLKVSLEWDARSDPAYLEQLRFNLSRASDILFDYTNGQAALGNVTIYHDREQWTNADIRIFANNQLRPYADIGGFGTQPITDPFTSTIVYGPGQLTMAATWNRYGTPGTVVGEDWPRTLAHELGHYMLYMWDNYIGLDDNDFVKLVTTCTDTVMGDEYQDDDSELRNVDNWLTDCGETFSQKMVNRSDWETVNQFYPWLIMPTEPITQTNPGPSSLPLAVTQITFVDPVSATTTLPDGRFYLSYNGGSYQPGPDALGWLFRDNQLIELGRPVMGQINARGARPGDRVCVIELSAGRAGCKTVVVNDNQSLALTSVISWTPDVRVTPVNSSTVRVNVYNLPSTYTMTARLYDDTGFATLTQTVPYDGPANSYSATLTLTEPVVAGWLHLTADSGREVVAVYTLGGNPTSKVSGGTSKRRDRG